MGTTNTIIDSIVSDVLDKFGSYTHMAVGSGTTGFNPTQTALITETFREAFADSIRNTGAGTFAWSLALGLTEGNGSTIAEVGLFDASSGGNMAIRNLLPVAFAKTADKELWVDLQVNVEVENT